MANLQNGNSLECQLSRSTRQTNSLNRSTRYYNRTNQSLSSDLSFYPKIVNHQLASQNFTNSLPIITNSLPRKTTPRLNSLERNLPQIASKINSVNDTTYPSERLLSQNIIEHESTSISLNKSQNEIKLEKYYTNYSNQIRTQNHSTNSSTNNPRMKPWLLIPIVGYS